MLSLDRPPDAIDHRLRSLELHLVNGNRITFNDRRLRLGDDGELQPDWSAGHKRAGQLVVKQ